MFTTFQPNVNAMTGSQMLQHFHIRQEHDKVRRHMIMKLKSDWKRHAENDEHHMIYKPKMIGSGTMKQKCMNTKVSLQCHLILGLKIYIVENLRCTCKDSYKLEY